jgi:4-hydroxy-tetrahydrodipicolinate reductase
VNVTAAAPAATTRWLALVALLAGGFLPPVDFFIVNVALPSIHESLNASPAEVQLVVSGYAAGYAVFLITGGRLGDLYGRRRCFLAGLVEETARRLAADGWDIEVFEAHHRRKVDAPSGTALMLGEAAARGRNVRLADVEARARDGITGARADGAIGFSVARGGGIVGEHSVTFAAEEEILTLSHSARDRALFARGALAAARWVASRPAGLYDMKDVLGFRAS